VENKSEIMESEWYGVEIEGHDGDIIEMLKVFDMPWEVIEIM